MSPVDVFLTTVSGCNITEPMPRLLASTSMYSGLLQSRNCKEMLRETCSFSQLKAWVCVSVQVNSASFLSRPCRGAWRSERKAKNLDK